MAATVRTLTQAGLPVMAHIGSMPQRSDLWEDTPVCGADEESAWELAEIAQAMEEAGAFAIFMERIAREAAALITERVDVPTIGLGCGPDCEGQALVFHQLLGLDGEAQAPKHVARFCQGDLLLGKGLQEYCRAVREGSFPSAENSTPMEEGEAQRLY